jgi:hypothetical protein
LAIRFGDFDHSRSLDEILDETGLYCAVSRDPYQHWKASISEHCPAEPSALVAHGYGRSAEEAGIAAFENWRTAHAPRPEVTPAANRLRSPGRGALCLERLQLRAEKRARILELQRMLDLTDAVDAEEDPAARHELEEERERLIAELWAAGGITHCIGCGTPSNDVGVCPECEAAIAAEADEVLGGGSEEPPF